MTTTAIGASRVSSERRSGSEFVQSNECEDEDGERVLLRDKMDGAGPHLDTWGEARAWALGRLST